MTSTERLLESFQSNWNLHLCAQYRGPRIPEHDQGPDGYILKH